MKNIDVSTVELTPEEITKALARPSSFGWFGLDGDGMFETWSLGPCIEHRDSTILDKANAKALRRYLDARPELADDWKIVSCTHWAVGWVDHLSYRVLNHLTGEPTRVAKILKAWFANLRDVYPVADDDLYSEMESDATWNWIAQEGKYQARKMGFKLPEDWQSKVHDWWDANDSAALENVDDQGASPSEQQFREAFEGCEFKREE
jgi:hypothetical protein